MKISYNWIQELLPDLKASPQLLAERLTAAGLEVESVTSLGMGLDNVVVAKVLEKSKHPNADRLNVCQVTDGTETFQIVCGAANVEINHLYPMARVGAHLPNGLTIKKSSIRGVESSGMLCSSKELGLESESEGLLNLAKDAVLGQVLKDHLGLNDTILEIALTPNRGDCLSHIGVATEVAALFKVTLKHPVTKADFITQKEDCGLSVTISSPHCSRYAAALIRGVRVEPSSTVISSRLKSLGIRPINNIVDATNYIMMLTGHPVHAFDAKSVSGNKISVLTLDQSLNFKTLDGKERVLIAGDIVIADQIGPIALAGIMGGQNSEVTTATEDIILEVAAFDANTIRKTARRLGIISESSYRFERGVPSETVSHVLQKLVELILAASPGSISAITDLYSKTMPLRCITLRQSRLDLYSGYRWATDSVRSILESLNLKVDYDQGVWSLEIPPQRFDLNIEEDIIEELIRFKGFETIETELPKRPLAKTKLPKEKEMARLVRSHLVAKGYTETINYSFLGKNDLLHYSFDLSNAVYLANPLSDELAIMRPSLLPQLLKTAANNLRHTPFGGRFFELRRVYSKSSEELILGVLSIGNFYPPNWGKVTQEASYYEMKGMLEELAQIGDLSPRYVKIDPSLNFLHPEQSAAFNFGADRAGFLGGLHPLLINQTEIKLPVAYLEIKMSALIKNWKYKKAYRADLSNQPVNRRDLSLQVPVHLSYAELEKSILKRKVNNLKSVNIFDIYTGEPVREGFKSISLSIEYGAQDRSLSDEEVNSAHFKLVSDLNQELGTLLR